MLTDNQKAEIVALLESLDSNTKIYLGCDSQRIKCQTKVRYATVLIVHLNGNKGARIFDHVSIEPDYEKNKKSPKLRLMNEAFRVCEMYLDVYEIIENYETEIHLDINISEQHASQSVAKQAAGYVLGVTGIAPKLKPEAGAASTGADRLAKGSKYA